MPLDLSASRCDGRSHHRALRATRTLVIEAAHFDAMTIARTSRRHKLSSEASRRFERGVDPEASYAAGHRVAELLVAHAVARCRRRPYEARPHRGPAPHADTLPVQNSRYRYRPFLGRTATGGHGATVTDNGDTSTITPELATRSQRSVRLRRRGWPAGRVRHDRAS